MRLHAETAPFVFYIRFLRPREISRPRAHATCRAGGRTEARRLDGARPARRGAEEEEGEGEGEAGEPESRGGGGGSGVGGGSGDFGACWGRRGGSQWRLAKHCRGVGGGALSVGRHGRACTTSRKREVLFWKWLPECGEQASKRPIHVRATDDARCVKSFPSTSGRWKARRSVIQCADVPVRAAGT